MDKHRRSRNKYVNNISKSKFKKKKNSGLEMDQRPEPPGLWSSLGATVVVVVANQVLYWWCGGDMLTR